MSDLLEQARRLAKRTSQFGWSDDAATIRALVARVEAAERLQHLSPQKAYEIWLDCHAENNGRGWQEMAHLLARRIVDEARKQG